MSTVDLASFIQSYDVRGRVADQVTPQVCRALGAAFARVVVVPEGHSQVALGHDMRESSPSLAQEFADGAMAAGVDVLDIGRCATDQLYFASGTHQVPGAMVTASHNPAAYNGIKVCRARAAPLSPQRSLTQVRDVAQYYLDEGRVGGGVPTGARVGTQQQHDTLRDYAHYLHSLVDTSTIRGLKIVVDAGNGMAGVTAAEVLGRLGGECEVIGLYMEPDGSFPHHEANPLDPKNLVDLQALVVERDADLGLAFDGDADRCFVVDEQGQPVTASAVAALVAAREVSNQIDLGVPAADITIVHTAVCSRAVPQTVRSLGARPVLARVGHTYVKAEMAAHNAAFGAEHSGHYYFRDFWGADTGMLAALHVLAALGKADVSTPISRLVGEFDPCHHSGEINAAVADVAAAADRVRAWALNGDPDVLVADGDGLMLTSAAPGASSWRVSVRPSNTEPLLRLNVEADDEATMQRVRDDVLELIQQVSSATNCPPEGVSTVVR